MDKKYIPLAIQLHEGRKISLGNLFIATIYQSLGTSYHKLKHLPETNRKYLFSGPLWLLQLWLNATFKPRLQITISKALMVETDARSIEGTKLALITPQDIPLQITFMKYINFFLYTKTFVSTMAPFVN